MNPQQLNSSKLFENPLFFFAHNTYRIGNKLNNNLLRYNPLLFAHFHRLAKHDAPLVAAAIRSIFPEVRDAVDVGCGSGAYAAGLTRAGVRVEACEHNWVGRAFAAFQGVKCVPFNLSLQPPADFNRRFDLAYCYEVAEHVPPLSGHSLVRMLVELAPTVIFTAAQPRQGGHGHINEQPKEYWIRQFEQLGRYFDAAATNNMIAALTTPCLASFWLPRNLMVFRQHE